MTRNPETPGAGQDEKARRLAEALRANLRRRKAQARARAAHGKKDGAPDEGVGKDEGKA